jgi:hypothetical protein
MLELVEELRARAPENADAIGVRFNANLMLKAAQFLEEAAHEFPDVEVDKGMSRRIYCEHTSHEAGA